MRSNTLSLSCKTAVLAALALAALFFFAAHAKAAAVVDVPLNQEISIVSPPAPLDQASAPKKLYQSYYASYAPYVKVYRYTVTPGQRYTFYLHYPPDMKGRYAYLSGANPNRDYTYSFTYKGKHPGGFVVDGHTSWKMDCPYLTQRNNITIDPESQTNYLWVVYTAQKPGFEARMMLKHPADPDRHVKSHTGPPPYCPKRKGYHWGQVWERPFLLALYPGEKEEAATQTAQPQPPPLSKLDRDQPPARAALNMSGTWEFIDSKGISSCRLTLTQSGRSLTGAAGYSTGSVPVSGTVEGSEVNLTFTYDNPQVMVKWVSLEVANQIAGIKGTARFTAGPNPDELTGTLFGWHVNWNAQKKVQYYYHGGTPEASQKNPPRSATLKRVLAAGATPSGPALKGACPWIEYISSGKPFEVAFDAVGNKFNDQRYTGDWRTDPMGTLKGGETYKVVYRNGKFSCTGFNQGTRKVGTWTYGGIDPADGLISLWGRVYTFDGLGRVWDPQYGLVGHIRATY